MKCAALYLKNTFSRRVFELVCILFIVTIFCLMAFHSSTFLIEEITLHHQKKLIFDESGHYYLLSTIISMGICGVSLIALLLIKVFSLNRLYKNQKETVDLATQRLAAIEAAGDGIGIVDIQGNLVYANIALMQLHGFNHSDMKRYINKPWTKLYGDKGEERIRENVIPVLSKDGYWQGEAPIRRKSGEIIDAEMSLTMLADGGMVGTARDITDRRHAEQDKANLQKQMYEAQKMEAIGRLAGGIAHDFNNILASIVGYAEFLVEDLNDRPEQKKFSANILKGAQQAKGLVEQMLTISRHSDSEQSLIDLIEVIEETIVLMRGILPETVDLQVQNKRRKLPVIANSTQLSQILMNLCVNAIDAMDRQNGTIAIEVLLFEGTAFPYRDMIGSSLPTLRDVPLRNINENGRETLLTIGAVMLDQSYCCIKFTDNGAGMGAEVMKNIFDPFFTTKDVGKGTGLGLSTVQGIVLAHKGAIAVRSTPGKGTCFEIFLPADGGSLNAHEFQMAASDLVRGQGCVILVEDQEQVRAVTEQMLVRLGYTVRCFPAADEALLWLSENPGLCDAVLTDHVMPGMTGMELAHEIGEHFPEVPVVLMTGYGPRKSEALMKSDDSICGFINKPVSNAKLSLVMSEAIRKKKKKV